MEAHGQTYAQEAGIRLKDTPSPLYRLLVLTTLLSVRISTPIAVAAAREISSAGWRTPRALAKASWQEVVDALGAAASSGGARAYDALTATEEPVRRRERDSREGQADRHALLGEAPQAHGFDLEVLAADGRPPPTTCAFRFAPCCAR